MPEACPTLGIQLHARIAANVDPHVYVRRAAEIEDERRPFQSPNVPLPVVAEVDRFAVAPLAEEREPAGVQSSLMIEQPRGLYGSARLRYFGPRPLVEDGSVESDSSLILNAGLGWRGRAVDLRVDVLNLLDAEDDDITYFYASRLPGEPAAGVEDLHFHPIEPRTVRVHASWTF